MPAQLLRTPSAPTAQAPAVAEEPEQTATLALQVAGGGGNRAVLDRLASPAPAADPTGGVFARIAGADASFGRDRLRAYLDQGLQFAEGEWFRGQKLDGATDALLAQLDADRNGRVDRGEFSAFDAQILSLMAPGAADAAPDRVAAAAEGRFAQIDTKPKDGRVGLAELSGAAKAALPEDTAHADLVAQLGARIALDALDTDQRDRKVADRQLSTAEWTQGAAAIAGRRR